MRNRKHRDGVLANIAGRARGSRRGGLLELTPGQLERGPARSNRLDPAAGMDGGDRIAHGRSTRERPKTTRREFRDGQRNRADVEEGRQAERAAQAPRPEGEKASCSTGSELSESFAAERGRYLHAVEQEVVELALAMAARILRREAQMDPLLLTGAVRVALGQLSDSTEVRFAFRAKELGPLDRAHRAIPNLTLRNPRSWPATGMRLGDCVMETELGFGRSRDSRSARRD